ncbi:MAG: bifunctional nuclease family protein [Phycisphaerales bacterium]|nr:bifunctional nuclease family protein [Phycisphaerales bacterium]
MKKVELEVIAIAQAQNKESNFNSHAVILQEVGGTRKLPIIIGKYEARFLHFIMEHIKPRRPCTHDILLDILDKFSIKLEEVLIYNLEEGIYFAYLNCINEETNKVVQIDSSSSDAVAIALRNRCRIYIYESILEQVSSDMTPPSFADEEQDNSPSAKSKKKSRSKSPIASIDDEFKNTLSSLSSSNLESLLEQVIEKEDYQKAIWIRDELKKRKQ